MDIQYHVITPCFTQHAHYNLVNSPHDKTKDKHNSHSSRRPEKLAPPVHCEAAGSVTTRTLFLLTKSVAFFYKPRESDAS